MPVNIRQVSIQMHAFVYVTCLGSPTGEADTKTECAVALIIMIIAAFAAVSSII